LAPGKDKRKKKPEEVLKSLSKRERRKCPLPDQPKTREKCHSLNGRLPSYEGRVTEKVFVRKKGGKKKGLFP